MVRVASRPVVEDVFDRQIDAAMDGRKTKAAGGKVVNADWPAREVIVEALMEAQYALAEVPGFDAPPERVVEDAGVALAISIDSHESLLPDRPAGVVDAVRFVFETTASRDARFEAAGQSIHSLGILVRPDPTTPARHVADDLAGLFDAGCSPAEALDFFMTTKGLISKREWADTRGVTERAVRKNVTEAENGLSD